MQVQVKSPTTGKPMWASEHVVVMEQMLGRPLRKGENVHHLNGDGCDNRPPNLELWMKTQPAGQRVCDRVDDAVRIIDQFGELFGVRVVRD